MEEIKRLSFPFRVKPVSDEYRIVEFQDRDVNKLHLEAKTVSGWVDTLGFDDGTQGFRKIGDLRDWKIGELRRLVSSLFGEKEEPNVLEVLRKKNEPR